MNYLIAASPPIAYFAYESGGTILTRVTQDPLAQMFVGGCTLGSVIIFAGLTNFGFIPNTPLAAALSGSITVLPFLYIKLTR